MLIVLTCVWTFQLWKKRWRIEGETPEGEELEESVRWRMRLFEAGRDVRQSNRHTTGQDEVICVEIERKRRMADENDDLVIPLDANGNVVIAISENSYNSSSVDVLPPRVPPVVRARPSVLQRQHLSSDEEGEREEEREFRYDIEAARGSAEFPELQNHGPEHTVGRRRRRNDSYSSVTYPTGDEIVHDGANQTILKTEKRVCKIHVTNREIIRILVFFTRGDSRWKTTTEESELYIAQNSRSSLSTSCEAAIFFEAMTSNLLSFRCTTSSKVTFVCDAVV